MNPTNKPLNQRAWLLILPVMLQNDRAACHGIIFRAQYNAVSRSADRGSRFRF